MTQKDLFLIYAWTLPISSEIWLNLSYDSMRRADKLCKELCRELGLVGRWTDPKNSQDFDQFPKSQ